jgi:DNA-binding transcriptional ArsR family regulator
LPKRTSDAIDQRLVKALAHPMRVRILSILNERVSSPAQMAVEFDENLSRVSYHVNVLLKYECIELVTTRPRRGATEHFYRGTARAYLGNPEWRQIPESVRGGVSAVVLQTLLDKALEALLAGTLDARDDSYLSWIPVVVDEEGWSEIAAIMAEALARILDAQTKSAERLVKAREQGITATVAVASFESPPAKQE